MAKYDGHIEAVGEGFDICLLSASFGIEVLLLNRCYT